MTHRRLAVAKGLIALAAAAATPHAWVAIPASLYALRAAVGQARYRHLRAHHQEHPYA